MASVRSRRRVRQRQNQSFSQLVEADFSRGKISDAPRTSIPAAGVADAADFLLHQQGIAIKRGGSAYAGPALGAASSAKAVAYAEFPAGPQLVAVGGDNNIYKVTAGLTTDLGGIDPAGVIDRPKLRVGGGKNLLVIPQANGTSGPIKYDGSAAPALLGGTPAAGKFCEIYKTRVVLAGKNGNENRLYFSPTPDIETTWDTANSYIDFDYAVTGMAALHNMLLVFSQGHVERLLGSTPPPGSDMDRAPVGSVGCTDARSIVVQEGNAIFANPRGVYLTNGAGFASLTTEGMIESYWQSLFPNYDPTTWTIAAGTLRSFYVVNVLDNNGALVAFLMCYVPRRAWWRITNHRGLMFASAVGVQDELYMADRSAGRIVALSSFLTPVAGNKNDANGTAVAPMLETKLLGASPGLKAFGYGWLSYDLRDAAADAPTLAVNVAPGVEATTFTASPESPFPATLDEQRRRFSINRDSQGVTVRFTQTGPSAKTELYGIDYEARGYTADSEGQ